MNIYMLKNFSLQEVYFGLSENDVHQAVKAHKGNQDSPVAHWEFEKEEIKWGIVQGDLSEVYAQAFLQALRREPTEDGWILVMGFD
ncbi:MAG: hypothetical protein HN356_04210 [Calditrichaeota bacterium]|nr:hypothetical protein [Calditrichota bacterium]MBT7617232.1 hypothetical protein [Calditrichota bacterium]